MGYIFCVKFQRYSLKFHTKYLTHTLKDVYSFLRWKLKSFSIEELVRIFETLHPLCNHIIHKTMNVITQLYLELRGGLVNPCVQIVNW